MYTLQSHTWGTVIERSPKFNICCHAHLFEASAEVGVSRGTDTDSSQGGQRFLEKIRREVPKIFFSLPTLVFS